MGSNRLMLLVGRRYAVSRRHSQLVSFISSVSIAGLIIGVALLILVLAIMNGFDRELRERILGIMPHAAVYHRDGIAEPQKLLEEIRRHPEVQAAVPFVRLQGLLSRHRQVAPVELYGIEPEDQHQQETLGRFLPEGVLATLTQRPQGVVLGTGLARTLGVEPGDRLTLVVPRRGRDVVAPAVSALEVLAIFDSGTEIDNNFALTGLERASELSEFPGSVTGIRLQVHDLFRAPVVVSELVRELPMGFYSSDWTRTHGNLYQAIHMSKRMVGLLLFLIIAIAAFNLVSTLIMVVVDKRGDIAILRTLGASSVEIMGIFMVQGGLIGLIGTGLGVVIGVLMALGVTDFVLWLERLLQIQFLHSDVYPINYLPASIHWPDVFQVAVTALVICLCASLYPAWRASRVQPAEALRYE
jgi:lipoprotein-releasing system permease protein